MSRFSNLEFESEPEGDLDHQPQHQTPVLDEHYYTALAARSFEQADFESALRNYSKVLEFNLGNSATWNGQLRSLIELGEFREAKVWADKALERFPDEAELLASKAVALARCGDTEAALAYSDAAIEQRGDSPHIWMARGDVLLARKEARANSCFERALALAPQDWMVAWLISRIHCFYEKFTQALIAASTALKWNPGNDMLWVQVGLYQSQLSMTGQASESFQHALDLNPRNRHALSALNEVEGLGMGPKVLRGIRRLFSR